MAGIGGSALVTIGDHSNDFDQAKSASLKLGGQALSSVVLSIAETRK